MERDEEEKDGLGTVYYAISLLILALFESNSTISVSITCSISEPHIIYDFITASFNLIDSK